MHAPTLAVTATNEAILPTPTGIFPRRVKAAMEAVVIPGVKVEPIRQK